MTVQDFLREAQQEVTLDMSTCKSMPFTLVRSAVTCLDGYCISIQQSPIHHCDNDSVEVAVPDNKAQKWFDAHGTDLGPCGQGFRWKRVYGWVDVAELNDWLQEEHSGIVGTDKSLKG